MKLEDRNEMKAFGGLIGIGFLIGLIMEILQPPIETIDWFAGPLFTAFLFFVGGIFALQWRKR